MVFVILSPHDILYQRSFLKNNQLLAVLILLASSFTTSQADSDREQHWDVYFSPNYVTAKTLSFNNDVQVDLNERTGWSLGFGFNFTNHVSGDFVFSSSNGSYSVKTTDDKGQPLEYSNNMYSSSMLIGMTYNIIDGPFTPYISGNIGINFADTGINDGGGYESCYYDPWYGYTCGIYETTKTSTEFSYGGSVGLRYDLENQLFLKAGVGVNVVNFNSNNTPLFTIYQLTIGSRF